MADGTAGRAAFSVLVRQLRQAAWLTQEQLAERSGLSPRTIQAIERERVSRPHRESVRLLADAFGLRGTARSQFEAAARDDTRTTTGECLDPGAQPCRCAAKLAGCLVHLLSTPGREERSVNLHGLGPTAHPALVLARLLRAFGIDHPNVPDTPEDRYGLAGAPVAAHTLPVHLLPGA